MYSKPTSSNVLTFSAFSTTLILTLDGFEHGDFNVDVDLSVFEAFVAKEVLYMKYILGFVVFNFSFPMTEYVKAYSLEAWFCIL
jgi:hypothetical protein